ncbi:MAG: sugar ABC transporter substrate-binding protein [Trueperaceae bacterium]|nr:sugar ABC transporter substrate-binding protein [Trueperaceae bacterium]
MSRFAKLTLALFAAVLIGAPALAQTVRIGYAPPVYDTLDYFGQFAAGFQEELTARGVDVEFIARASTAEANVQQQLDIVEDLIVLGVDYIIVGPIDYFAIVPALQAANEAGVPIFVINHLAVHPEESNVDVLAYSGYFHEVGGEVTANWALENLLQAGDEVGLMYAEPGNQISEARVGSARDIWTAAGIEIAFEHYAYWEQARAFDATERLVLAHPNVKAIYAGNSAMAMGTATALAGMGRSDIAVFGYGAVAPELDMIWEGLIKGAIFRDSQSSGRYIAEAVYNDLNGLPIEKQYPLDMLMVASREDILTKVPVDALRLMENWPEVEAELARRGN